MMQQWRHGFLGLDLFSASIDALPHCPGQGPEGQAWNQWGDILGSLFAPTASRLCSRPTFPGLSQSGLLSLGRLPRK